MLDTSGSMSSNFPKVVQILNQVYQLILFGLFEFRKKALKVNQTEFATGFGEEFSYIKFNHVVLIPVGAKDNFRSCPYLGRNGVNPCG